MSKLLISFFEQHKGMRRLSKSVLLILVIFATWRIFMNLTDVTPSAAVCYSTLVSMFGAAMWKYMDVRQKEDSK